MARTVEGIDDLVGAANLVFGATVTRCNTSNEPTVPPGQDVIVRVEVDQRVTPPLATWRPGSSRFNWRSGSNCRGATGKFFSRRSPFRSPRSSCELGHFPWTPEAGRELREALENEAVRRLQCRCDGARLMVVGVVEEI